jgi:Uma2 family endonuclease
MADITAKIGMPLDEFMELSNDQPFELINGERIPKMPNVFGHSEMIRHMFLLLYSQTQAEHLGEVYSETTFILPDVDDDNWVDGSRIPDVMFYANDRIAKYKAENPNHRARPLALVPDLVIEVVSPTDKFSELDEKVDAYLLDGVRLIWVLDPQRRKTTVHAPDLEQPQVLKKEDDVLDGGDIIPGFKIALSKLFE